MHPPSALALPPLALQQLPSFPANSPPSPKVLPEFSGKAGRPACTRPAPNRISPELHTPGPNLAAILPTWDSLARFADRTTPKVSSTRGPADRNTLAPEAPVQPASAILPRRRAHPPKPRTLSPVADAPAAAPASAGPPALIRAKPRRFFPEPAGSLQAAASKPRTPASAQ